MNDTSSAIAPDTLLASSDSVSGLAMLGKTATALAVVIGVILLCAWLLRRLHGARPLPGEAPASGFAERLARAVRQAPGSTTPDRRP